MITTRWVNLEEKSINEIIEIMCDVPENEINETSSSYVNWKIEKIFDENMVSTFNGNKIEYNYIKYNYDYISPGNQPIEDRRIRHEGIVIPYFNGNSVNFIINRNSDAQRILRKILKYTGKKEIEKNMFSIGNDFYMWLINKVYNNENIIESINDDLHSISLDAIKGFKGDTDDLLTKVSANGESVMNIISTLSFFLESRNLNQISLELKYYKHQRIMLDFRHSTDNGLISIYDDKYLGIFEDEREKNKFLPKLILLIYLEIIPLLVQSYNSDVENGIWGEDANINFLRNVAEELSDRVDTRINNL